ncbi:MAG TPA: dihydroorotate dehydrogenase, partial [Sphaerochaeta sp.]|nr:dihydroorotate dehydrogenase [Sphaerochaeta sp.]
PLLYIDPASRKPILQNRLGGKGGQSGKAVFPIALKAIKEIREALGTGIPIIGMGGVDSGADAAKLIEAGANVVGIGSALGTVDQRSWPQYLRAIKEEADHLLYSGKKPAVSSASFIKTDRQMEYRKHIVLENEPYGSDTAILRLDGRLPTKAGQFAFLWLPQIGEKPFSVAHNDPLTFVIKRRGPFSDALCSLRKGDEVYIRGLYGQGFDPPETKKALLIGGGTGVAVLPALAEQLSERGTEVEILVGTSEAVETTALLEEKLSSYGSFVCVADEGKPGRVLDLLDGRTFDGETACYLVGPQVFMALAARAVLSGGVKEEMLYLSQELMTLCGIGMCGECVCGDRLTCRWGTFMEYRYLKEHAPSLIAYD